MVSPDSDIQNFNKNFPVPEASNNQRINLECVSDPSAGTFYTVLMDGSTIKVWKRDSSKNYVLQKIFTPQKEYLSSQYDDFVVWIKKEGATERLVLLNLQRDTDALIVKTSIKLIILPKDNTPTWELTLIEKKVSREGSSNVNLYYHDNEDRFSPLKLIKTDTIGQVFILGTKVNN
jgi:hypothetical protein